VGLFAQLPLNVAESPLRDIIQDIENCDTVFGWSVKKRLIEILMELENQTIETMITRYPSDLKTIRYTRTRRDDSLMQSA